MSPAEILRQHEPEDVYTGGGAEYEGIECAWCSPRQLLVHPLHDWDAFAEHLATMLEQDA